MKKLQVKTFADFFGKILPLGKIKDANTRKEVVLLAASLRKYGKDVDDDLESIRVRFTQGHEAEIDKWVELTNKAIQATSEEEKAKWQKEADACTEAVRVDREYHEATSALFEEEMETPNIHKIGLITLMDALNDSEKFLEESSMDSIAQEFKDFIND